MIIEGGCLCRAVRYGASAEPIVTRTCWCRECQYIGAGSATVNVCFFTAAVHIQGTTGDHRSMGTHRSAHSADRRAATACGVIRGVSGSRGASRP